MADLICLDATYSTTRLLTREKAVSEDPPVSKIQSMLFLPPAPDRQGEGGLRTRGYFKHSLPGKPLLSVITVVLNGEQHLQETIQSVINQTYDNVEYIIIDGGSTDGTVGILKKYEDKIDYWLSEPDNGVYDAINKGLELISSCWINIMNCGDMFSKDTSLINCIKYLSDKYIILYSDTIFYKYLNNIIYYKHLACDHRKLNIIHQSCIYNINLHRLYGNYISNKEITISDYFFFNLIPPANWYKVDHIISMYLIDNNISSGFRHQLQKLCVDILMKNETYCKSTAKSIISYIRYTMSNLLKLIFSNHFYTTKIAKFTKLK
jgi:glycosyltransferase involved in cell wall biosynthesis